MTTTSKPNLAELAHSLDTEDAPMRIKYMGLEFSFEKRLYKKLLAMCNRITKPQPELDACLQNEGNEGEGKTNASLIEAVINHMLISQVHKDVSIHLFFKTSSCIEFAKNSACKIIILDEPALESLSNDQTSINKDLFRLITTCRKKRHFLIVNFTKFWKFPDWLVVDRALGMVKMYSKQGKDPGRFIFIRKRHLEKLWNDKIKRNERNYRRYKSFGGRMPFYNANGRKLMEDIFKAFVIQVEGIVKATLEDYETQKDLAIASIGEEKQSKKERQIQKRLDVLRYRVSQLPKQIPILTQKLLSEQLKVDRSTISEWESLKIKAEEA
jgi:hypothetical protein